MSSRSVFLDVDVDFYVITCMPRLYPMRLVVLRVPFFFVYVVSCEVYRAHVENLRKLS